jgi:hypothetical protein
MLFGISKKCHNKEIGSSLCIFVRRVIKETVVAMGAYPSYRLIVTYLPHGAESFLRS